MIATGGCSAGAQSDHGRVEPVTVLAASSLTEAFTTIAAAFEVQTGDRVTLSFGSSTALATQLANGAPADVFAAANDATMEAAVSAGAADSPRSFATNTLEIAVPPGNPGRVKGLADFANRRLRIAVCAPQVPCGSAAEKVFAAAGISPEPDSYEQDVKAALQKVVADEVDAALVYRTDVAAAGEAVAGIEVPEAASAVNRYPIATVRTSRQEAEARAFVDFVLSSAGQQILREAGFGAP